MTLYPFQEQCVEFHLAHHYSLNACPMGLGKSRIALETAKRTNLKAAVFGPAFLAGTWKLEMAAVGVDYPYYPYSQLHNASMSTAAKFWIADESHYLKTPTTQRTAAFYSLLQKASPEYLIFLSGTPIKNRLPDIWTIIGWCGLNPHRTSGISIKGTELGKYKAFCRHFCKVEKFQIRGRWFEKYAGIKDEKIPELKALLKDKMIRFRVEDVLKDLPPITRKEVWFEEESLDDGGELLELFEAYQEGSKIDPTAKARSALLKTPHTAEYAKNILEETGGPLLIFSDHVEPVKRLAETLGNAVAITGQTPVSKRQEYVDAFQAGRLKVIAATIGSLSVGVTLTRANHVVFNDLSWLPSDNEQALKRIHRIGQDRPCWAHFIQATETDRHIYKTLMAKMETIKKVID